MSENKQYEKMSDHVEFNTGTHYNHDAVGTVFINMHWNSNHVLKAAKDMEIEITRPQANEIMKLAIKNYNPSDEGFSWEYLKLHIDNFINPQVSPEEMADAQDSNP